MDLAAGAKKLIIVMSHTNSDGSGKIVPQCTLPLTAMKAVDMIITELAVFEFRDGVLTLVELMPGATLEQVRAETTAAFSERLK
jgi:3-oxoacid CoA-transferase